jgi:cold shock CspA family protein
LLKQNKNTDAIQMLKSGFELDETLQNKYGLRIVTPALISALKNDGRISEANDFYNRAISIAPKDKLLQRTKHRILYTDDVLQKTGYIKKILRHKKGYLYGFITTDDGSSDIYFNERIIDSSLMPKLVEGMKVSVEIEIKALV